MRSPAAFGRYLLVEPLSEGGMACVYRAVLRDVSGFEKTVALKRVRSELGQDPEFIARFIDEARIASTLSHGNIVQVFDFGQVDGEHYLTMELVDGPDLGQLMAACRARRQPVPIPTAVHLIAEVARGLGAAHERRPTPVVHRDVSPQNVLISRSGEVKVADFGIALAAEKVLRTRTGLVLGKCRYMAPEQARGEPLDARADLFAAGCLLFELLGDGPLFDGESAEEVMRQVLSRPIPLLSSRNPEVPPELDEIVARTLDRRREARPADGSALARELEALLHRMAPEFSRDDLAALIRAVVPARRWLDWQAVRTAPDAPDPAMAATDRLVPEAAAPRPPSAPRPAESWEPPSVLVATAATRAEGPARGLARRPSNGWLLLVGALLLGATAGSLSARRAGGEVRLSLAAAQTVRHGAFELRLEELSRESGAVALRLWVRAPASAGPRGLATASLEAAGRSTRPRLCASRARDSGEEWRLAFPAAPAGAPLALRLHPPGTRPLRLGLVERAP